MKIVYGAGRLNLESVIVQSLLKLKTRVSASDYLLTELSQVEYKEYSPHPPRSLRTL